MEGTNENLETETYIAGADLKNLLYRLVKLDANGEAVLSVAPGDYSVGILARNATRTHKSTEDVTGDAVTVAKIKGKVPMVASAAITAGNIVVAAADGKIQQRAGTDPADATAGDVVLGTAMEAASGDGQVITINAAPVFAAA
ncbi:MAG: hypothetical protein ACR2QF_06185 [Geminicoccaceae bacterium]